MKHCTHSSPLPKRQFQQSGGKAFPYRPCRDEADEFSGKSVGAPLFERTNRGIRLTPAGESFLKDAKTILRYTRKSIERAQIAAGQTPHLPTCGAQKAGSVHPAAPLPTDREERNRRESARRHADIAEAQGKSAEEIHEIFEKVMNGTGRCSKR